MSYSSSETDSDSESESLSDDEVLKSAGEVRGNMT